MPTYRRRLAVVIIFAVICFLGVIWLSFSPSLLHAVGESRVLLLILICLLPAPIAAYYRAAKRLPRLAVGLAVLSLGLILCAVSATGYFLLGIDNELINVMDKFSEILFALASLIFVWQGVRSRSGSATTR